MATLTLDLLSPGRLTINVEGRISQGDTERFQALVNAGCEGYKHSEGPAAITAALNSPGGDYLEGLALGNLFWRNGYATLVRANAECYSAAATAFLGGAYLGAVGGWGPDRTVEIGGTVGFHSFYSNSSEIVPMRDGIEHGKHLLMFLTDYATALRIDMTFILESLKKGPKELLLLESVEQFRKLGIKLHGTERACTLTHEGAVLAANYATKWRRPVSLWPRNDETLAQVRELSACELRQTILKALVSRTRDPGPVSRLIQSALSGEQVAQTDAIFRDLESLNAVPYLCLRDDQRALHVAGFDFGGGSYVTDCYVIPTNEGTSNFAITVVTVNTGSSLEAMHYCHSGDCLYEVRHPSDLLRRADN